jgi:hypothetical protein
MFRAYHFARDKGIAVVADSSLAPACFHVMVARYCFGAVVVADMTAAICESRSGVVLTQPRVIAHRS